MHPYLQLYRQNRWVSTQSFHVMMLCDPLICPPLQILVWADKLALQSGKVRKRDADSKWRLKAADAVAMHCLHKLKVCLLTCWPFSPVCGTLAAMMPAPEVHVLISWWEKCVQ